MKEYKRKTAGGWLKKATIRRTVAGTFEVFIEPDIIVLKTSDGKMAMRNQEGLVTVLEMSRNATEKLDSLLKTSGELRA